MKKYLYTFIPILILVPIGLFAVVYVYFYIGIMSEKTEDKKTKIISIPSMDDPNVTELVEVKTDPHAWPDDSFMKTATGNPEDFGSVQSSGDNFAYVDTGPTTATSSKISFTFYSNVVRDLPPITSEKQYFKELLEISGAESQNVIENLKEEIYAIPKKDRELALRFSDVDLIASDVKTLPSGVKIVYLCNTFSNHRCYGGIYIVKNNKIVFDTLGSDLIASDNGFSVQWIPHQEMPWSDFPRCCKPGYRTTYFDHNFNPIGERDTIFTKVYPKS